MLYLASRGDLTASPRREPELRADEIDGELRPMGEGVMPPPPRPRPRREDRGGIAPKLAVAWAEQLATQAEQYDEWEFAPAAGELGLVSAMMRSAGWWHWGESVMGVSEKGNGDGESGKKTVGDFALENV